MKARRIVRNLLLAILAIAIVGFAAFKLSPWPSVWLIRYAFDSDAAKRNAAAEAKRPADVAEIRDEHYGVGADETLDVYFPASTAADATLPAIVWIHGGAFVAGDKADVAAYLRLLAQRGYATVGINYTIAPRGVYPTPVLQSNRALAFVQREAARFHVDANRIVLAGDSAGSQIVAQLAAAISDPAYAKRVGMTPALARDHLRGVVLFCGAYDADKVNRDGPFGWFIDTSLWSYFGAKNIAADDPRMTDFAVNRHVTAAFPPTFVSAGNADPLAPQSVLMADALRVAGVSVDTLFFPKDYKPPLGHEYQLDTESLAGRTAFDTLVAFLAARSP